jgi:hypothetical protein
MLQSKRILFLLVILSIAISSCNLPTGIIPAGNPPDLVATITAQALLLQSPTQTLAVAVAEVQVEANTPTATNTPEVVQPIAITETPQPTSTAGVPTVTVSADTNCRSGPGVSFSSDYSLLIGQSAEVVGKNTPTNYWIINVPGKAGATCWLWGKYATVSGDTSGLKEYEIPATPTPTSTAIVVAPAAVSNLSEQNTCVKGTGSLQNVSGTITWKDNSNNENGFNIYQRLDGAGWADLLVGSAGPNSTSYDFNVQTLGKAPFSLKVEAYNNAGASQRKAINIALNCP